MSKTEEQNIKLEKVDDKTAYENLLVKYAELKADNDARKFAMTMSEKGEKQLREQIEKMKCCGNCSHRRYWGNELGCKLDLDKQFECDNNNKKYWEFREE